MASPSTMLHGKLPSKHLVDSYMTQDSLYIIRLCFVETVEFYSSVSLLYMLLCLRIQLLYHQEFRHESVQPARRLMF